MKRNLYPILCLLLVFVGSVHAQEEENHEEIIAETVAKARAYMGDEAALKSVSALRMEGVLVYGNGDSGTVSVVYKKPLQQRFTIVINDYKEISSLNKTEGWHRTESISNPGSWSLDFYQPDDVLHIQAKVREALSFLAKPNTRKGRIEYAGTEEVNGETARVLMYYHTDDIWFRRYINQETGRVMYTVTDKGVIFQEEGEMMVDGIRFPEKLVTRARLGNAEQRMEVRYTSIKLNPKVDDGIFEVPLMTKE